MAGRGIDLYLQQTMLVLVASLLVAYSLVARVNSNTCGWDTSSTVTQVPSGQNRHPALAHIENEEWDIGDMEPFDDDRLKAHDMSWTPVSVE